jgi:TIR domain-containing protein
MSKIVICCRTSDSFGISGRIFDCLVKHFGRGSIFLDDLNATDSQFDWKRFGGIQDRARQADIVLASVGQYWLNGIQDEDDPVRKIIRTALEAGVVVTPVLVNGARMPAAEQLPQDIKNFAFRNATVIDPGPNFDSHVERLIRSIESLVGSTDANKSAPLIQSGRTEIPESMARLGASQPSPALQRLNPAPAGNTAQIFISHSSHDCQIAETIVQALEFRGLRCWISSRDVAGGENYQEAIVHAIRNAKIMLLVFTDNANNSDEIKKELVLASRNKLTVIPVRIEDVLPNDALDFELATRQWINFFGDWERALDTLCKRASGILQG